jgi:hypothetical protein
MTSAPEDPSRGAADAHERGMPNTGVYIGGGSFNGPVAAGYQAQAFQSNYSQASDDDLARIEDLLKKLEVGVRGLRTAQAEDTLDDIDGVRQELRRHTPDPSRISQLLARITAVVAPVASLLEVADRAKDLITVIMH